MDSNDDSIFNFITTFTDIELDKDNLNGQKGGAANMFKSTNGVIGQKPNTVVVNNELFAFKKDFKSLFTNISDQNDIGSIGNSDKSLSSFGSESNDSNGDSHSAPSETIISSLNGIISNNNNSNDSFARQIRESSQSPAFFGFSSSSSSSPPLSQTSGPSSASSLSEAVTTTSIKYNSNLSNNTIYSNSNKNNSSNYSNLYNSNSNKSPFSTKKDNNSSFFNSNPIDDMFGSILSHNPNSGLTNGSIGGDNSTFVSSLLDTSSTFSSNDIPNLEQRRFSSQSQSHGCLLPTSFSQDSLPHFLQNSFSPFSSDLTVDNGTLPSLSNNRKLSSFANNSANQVPANSNSHPTTSSVVSNSSSIKTTPLFSNCANNNFLYNGSIEQQQQHAPSTSSFGSNQPNIANVNANMQLKFESHMRSMANDINSTVQLYLNALQMRKDQLLKQMDHVKNTYMHIMSQNKGKSLNQIPFQRITFTRPDQALFKSITSLGFLNSPSFAPYCLVTGEGLSLSIEGEPTCLLISTKNCFNEEVLNGGENIDVDIQPGESNAHQNGSIIPVLPHFQKNILDNNNGKYSVTYIIPRGSNIRSVKIFININGLPVSNSPFMATVKTERLSETWKRIAVYGEEGAEPGKFCRPWGVALAQLPLKHDPNHKPIGDLNNQNIPIHSKPFYNWNCMNKTKKDHLLAIADRSNNRIQLLKLVISDSAISNTQSDNILLSNYNPNANVDISVLHVFGSGPGTRSGQFDRPAGIAINHNIGQLIVSDKDNHRIQVFDLAGNFQFKFGEKGSRPGQFCYPWDIAICPQTSMILVSDTRNRRIQLFTHYGQYLWHCGQPLDSPRGVAFLSPERYLISDFNKHRLLIIDKNENRTNSHISGPNHRDDLISSKYIGFGEGSAWGEFLRPQGLVAVVNKNVSNGATTKHVQIMCADSRNNRIAIWNSLNQSFEYINDDISKSDNVTNLTASFDRPSGIALAGDLLAVVDFGNNRLQIFQKTLT